MPAATNHPEAGRLTPGQALIISYRGLGPARTVGVVGRELFRSHLDSLSESGVRPLTITQLAAALRGGTLPPRAVAITFDGGSRQLVDEAAPLLMEHDFV